MDNNNYYRSNTPSMNFISSDILGKRIKKVSEENIWNTLEITRKDTNKLIPYSRTDVIWVPNPLHRLIKKDIVKEMPAATIGKTH